MAKQREKPGPTARDYFEARGIDTTKGTFSGTQIENFREGWAKFIMGKSTVGHYFERSKLNTAYAESLCNETVSVRWLYGLGNYPKCKKCLKAYHRLKR
jgi:hypothetical protein